MASEFTERPRLTKGALLIYESQEANAKPAQRIVFSYNPEQLRRSFATRAPQQQPERTAAARADVLRVGGPPVETITMSVVLDAADQLAEPEAHLAVVEHGLLPQLAQLELLQYPASAGVSKIERQAEQGAVEVAPADVPLVMLAWGQTRIVPVRLQSFSVTEERFDPRLNPIAAKVELGLQVLTYMEFPRKSAARESFIAHQKEQERLAGLLSGGSGS
jgi:hypothetical protein